MPHFVPLIATPGSTIKAIQLVVDALRINKVEARRDDDPDVKQYIHDRETEEIIVKQASASKATPCWILSLAWMTVS